MAYDLVDSIGIRSSVIDEDSKTRTWMVRLSYEGRSMRVRLHSSVKRTEPIDTRVVMYGLLADTASVEGLSFDQWCLEFGYSNDSIKALKMYKACLKELKQLRRVFGDAVIAEMRVEMQDY